MTYTFLALSVILGFGCFYFFRRARYWHHRYVASGISVELHLATQKQIIDELRNRPNVSFLMLEPEEDDEGGLVVTTHAWNLQPKIILASLKTAHDAMVEHLGVDNSEDDS